jgi:hypothetical protein
MDMTKVYQYIVPHVPPRDLWRVDSSPDGSLCAKDLPQNGCMMQIVLPNLSGHMRCKAQA